MLERVSSGREECVRADAEPSGSFGSFVPDRETVRAGSGFLVRWDMDTDWLLDILFFVETDILL